MCHQITSQKLGTPDSYTGGYVIDTQSASRSIYGPFEIDKGRTTVMRSSSGFTQQQGQHIQQSELCATCHTLVTIALGARGEEIGRLPEQMPYEEWKHSDYAATRTCQDCHMPAVEDTPVSSVLGNPRRLARHQFVGGNFFMLRMLNRYREDLAVVAPSTELDRSVNRTIAHLQREAAALSIDSVGLSGSAVPFDVTAQNLSGHKLPTGYPLAVPGCTSSSATVAECCSSRGRRVNGADCRQRQRSRRGAGRAALHADHQPDQADHESVMSDSTGRLTTALNGVFPKDNRLLPRGLDKATAGQDIAVVGAAAADADFAGGRDHVRTS